MYAYSIIDERESGDACKFIAEQFNRMQQRGLKEGIKKGEGGY